MTNVRSIDDLEYEILALFDDDTALSQMEDILLNAELYNFNLFNMSQIQTRATMENCQEIKKEIEKKNDCQNNECQNNERQSNETNKTSNQDKDKDVFAIPKVYSCMYCQKRYYNRTAIRRHQLNHAKEQLRCPRCRMRSYTFGILRRHYIYFHYIHRKRYICRVPMKE